MRSRVEAHAGPYLARPIVLAAVALFALLAALVIAAPAHAQTPSVSPTASPTASPTGTAIPRTTVLAPIESLEVQALPSGVVQVVVVSGLPEAHDLCFCAIRQRRDVQILVHAEDVVILCVFRAREFHSFACPRMHNELQRRRHGCFDGVAVDFTIALTGVGIPGYEKREIGRAHV